jgi:hypothetical protein
MSQLLIETNLFEANIHEQDGKLIVSGVLQRAGAKNQNGRVYPKDILSREVQQYQQLIDERRALGELDHPDSSVVNLQNVSHNVVEIGWEGDDVVGKVEILPTPSGNILRELFKNGIRLGISSRGMGSVKDGSDGLEVQEDFNLIAFDFVSNPSTHGAFLSPVNEGVNTPVCNTYCKTEDIIGKIILELGQEYGV